MQYVSLNFPKETVALCSAIFCFCNDAVLWRCFSWHHLDCSCVYKCKSCKACLMFLHSSPLLSSAWTLLRFNLCFVLFFSIIQCGFFKRSKQEDSVPRYHAVRIRKETFAYKDGNIKLDPFEKRQWMTTWVDNESYSWVFSVLNDSTCFSWFVPQTCFFFVQAFVALVVFIIETLQTVKCEERERGKTCSKQSQVGSQTCNHCSRTLTATCSSELSGGPEMYLISL